MRNHCGTKIESFQNWQVKYMLRWRFFTDAKQPPQFVYLERDRTNELGLTFIFLKVKSNI